MQILYTQGLYINFRYLLDDPHCINVSRVPRKSFEHIDKIHKNKIHSYNIFDMQILYTQGL